MHTPIYCSNDRAHLKRLFCQEYRDLIPELEDILYKNRVDVVISGHYHFY
jgi:hypothetical protein